MHVDSWETKTWSSVYTSTVFFVSDPEIICFIKRSVHVTPTPQNKENLISLHNTTAGKKFVELI